jgi:hypothetical protein
MPNSLSSSSPGASHISGPSSIPTSSFATLMPISFVTWNVSGLFVASEYDSRKLARKLWLIMSLSEKHTVVALQETHGSQADLGEFQKWFPSARLFGTFRGLRMQVVQV